MLFIVGAPPLREAETNPLQGGFDQIALARPVTKWACRITNTERIPDLTAMEITYEGSPETYAEVCGPMMREVFGDRALEYLLRFFEYEQKTEPLMVTTTTLQQLIGRRPLSLREWIAEHKDALLGR